MHPCARYVVFFLKGMLPGKRVFTGLSVDLSLCLCSNRFPSGVQYISVRNYGDPSRVSGVQSMLYKEESCTAYRWLTSTCCIRQHQRFRDLAWMSTYIADYIRRLQRHIPCSSDDLIWR